VHAGYDCRSCFSFFHALKNFDHHFCWQGSTPDVSLYNAAIHGMCLKGKYQSAKKLYLKMRDIGLAPDGKTRAMMLQYMQKNST